VPDVAMQVDEAVRSRKERVHTTMLIELLVTLVFLAMAFAFVQKDEQSASVLQTRIDELTRQLAQVRLENSHLRAENSDLSRINQELRYSLARWMERPRQSIPASEQPIVLPKSEYIDLKNRLTNAEAMAREAQRENGMLRGQLGKKGGTDLPNCTVTAGFLLSIEFLPDGTLRSSPTWQPGAEQAVRSVPGIAQIATGQGLGQREFSVSAAKAAVWGRSQVQACGFRVQVVERHADLDLYKQQLRTVERYFYVRRN